MTAVESPDIGIIDETAAVAALHPRAPRTMEEAGLSHDLLTQLLLKVMHFGADYTGIELARRVGLQFSVIEPVLEFLKRSHQCEVYGGSMLGGFGCRLERRKDAHDAGGRFRFVGQPQLDGREDAERSLAPDEKVDLVAVREITGGILSGPVVLREPKDLLFARRSRSLAPLGMTCDAHPLDRFHPLSHGAVAQRVRAGGVRGGYGRAIGDAGDSLESGRLVRVFPVCAIPVLHVRQRQRRPGTERDPEH